MQILLFASWGDALGASLSLDLPAGSTVKELVDTLRRRVPHRELPQPMVAVNQRYAKWDQVILPDDEVAIIPPVAGG